MLTTIRHKQAKDRGYQARIDGYPITKNYYQFLGGSNQVYSSLWETGWNEADEKLSNQTERE